MHTADVDAGPVAVRGSGERGRAPSGRTVALGAMAGLGLIIGALVYLTDRKAASSLLLPSVASLQGRHLFGALGLCLPSFLHTFSFSLLTAVARPLATSPPWGACATWWAVNVAFELGQHPRVSPWLTESLRFVLGDSGLTRMLSSYFLRGTFDIGDIAAATAGALAAAAVLQLVHPPRSATCDVK